MIKVLEATTLKGQSSHVKCFKLDGMGRAGRTYLQTPAGDSEGSGQSQRRKAAALRFVIDQTGVGAYSVGKVMNTHREMFAAAAADAKLIQSCALSLEATNQLIQVCHLSWSELRAMKTLLGHHGYPISLASEKKIKEWRRKFQVQSEFFEVELQGGSKKKKFKAVQVSAMEPRLVFMCHKMMRSHAR